MPKPNLPRPGSCDAVSRGCTCPPWPNCHGRGLPMTALFGDKPMYSVDPLCTMHGEEKEK